MLHLVDESLASLLRAEVPLRRDVDVSFATPDDTWAAGVTKPTVNLFLYDVRRNADRQHAGWTTTADQDGRSRRRQPTHHVDCRYLVTVWAAEAADQHQLLGAVLVTLLDVGLVPEEHLAGALAGVRPPPLVTAAWPTEREPFEFWSALGGRLRAGIELTVTLPVDRRLAVEVGPPVERVRDRVAPVGEAGEPRQRVAGRAPRTSPEGTVVWTPRGAGRVAGDGSFLVAGEEGDEVRVAVPETGAVVPDEGPVVLEGDDGNGRAGR